MRSEKVLKREDGFRVKLIVMFEYCGYRNDMEWNWEILTCPARKRKFIDPVSTDDYEYRRLNLRDRVVYKKEVYGQYITKEEVLHAMTELWNSLKPTVEDV